MNQIQVNPVPIYELDLNVFRLTLKDLEDGEQGITYLKTHNHNPPFDVGGVTLARTVELVNGYTVTFEDGQYAVNLIGANSNVGDNVNVNQVSVRSFNSAGLVTSAAIEFGEYGGAVTIDADNITGSATNGSIYPTGTLRQPVDNVPDAVVIADARGFSQINVVGNLTLGGGDNVENFSIIGTNPIQTLLTIGDSAETLNCEISECRVTGVLDGGTLITNCHVSTLNYINGQIINSMLGDTIILGGNKVAHFIDCYSEIDGNPPIIDCGGSGQPLAIREYHGEIHLINKTGTDKCEIDMDSGEITIESTVTNGIIEIRGVTGELTDNSTGSAVVRDESINLNNIWNYENGDSSVYKMLSEVWNLSGGNRLISNNREYFYNSSGDTMAAFVLLDEAGDSTETNVYERVKFFPA